MLYLLVLTLVLLTGVIKMFETYNSTLAIWKIYFSQFNLRR